MARLSISRVGAFFRMRPSDVVVAERTQSASAQTRHPCKQSIQPTLNLERVISGGKWVYVLAAIFVLLNNSAQASAGHLFDEEKSWLRESGTLLVEPNNRWQLDMHVSPQTSDEEQTSTLPNGADGLKENYGDWGVECRIVEERRKCSVGQYQYNQQQRVTIFSIEILLSEDGNYSVLMVMPFGLNLSDGVLLRLDDQAADQRASFLTCLPSGCLAPLKFSPDTIETMKRAKDMRVSATAFGGGQSPTFIVSLKGFSNAIQRLKDLQ